VIGQPVEPGPELMPPVPLKLIDNLGVSCKPVQFAKLPWAL